MKRSKAVALSLMSVSAILLQSCDEPEVEAQIFRDVKNCIETGELTEQMCMELHKDALADHLKDAPRYKTREECYAEFGPDQCEPRSTVGGGGIWMPLMMGFVASRMLDGVTGRNSSQPLYRTRTDPGSMRTGGGAPVSGTYGAKTKLPEWAAQSSRSRTQTVSRGGFGSRASSSGG
jgi:uncharacterized protein YgiB involved in biofilm formation